MHLITLDFKTILLVIAGLVLLNICHRIVWFLARLSDGGLGFLTRVGLRGTAKVLLSILVHYDERSYYKSQFMFRNQVPFRFAIFWSITLVLLVLLSILKVGRSVNSVGQPFLLIMLGYITYRCFMHWVIPRKSNGTLTAFNQEVKEQLPSSYSLIRRWDYLDELFASSH